jgi:hypothetical protein
MAQSGLYGTSQASPVPIESWLAGLAEVRRPTVLAMYLDTIDEQYRDAEKRELLRLAKQAAPIRLQGIAPFTLERKARVILKAPLFVFGAPAVTGCEVALQTYATQGLAGQWRVVLGAGGGPSKSIQASLRATFTATAGEKKRVFLPVQAVAVRRYVCTPYSLTWLGQRLRWYSLEPVNAGNAEVQFLTTPSMQPGLGDQTGPVPGVETVVARQLSPAALHAAVIHGTRTPAPRLRTLYGLGPGPLITTFPLKGDASTGHSSAYELTFEATDEIAVQAGGTFLGSTVSTNASVRLIRGLSLKFVLVGGHDYHLRRSKSPPGIEWTLD